MVISKPKPAKQEKAKKRKKKTSRQLYEIELDRLVRQIVLLRDGGCVCPAPKNGHSVVLQPGHLITRGKENTRWSLWNTNCQCSSCNLVHEFQPERYTRWFIQSFSPEAYTQLVAESEEINKLSLDELMELRNQLTEIHQKQLAEKTFKPRFSQRQILSGEWRNVEGKNPIQQSRNLEATVLAVSTTGTFVAG